MNLFWSSSGKYIISGADSGRIAVRRLGLKESNTWAVLPASDLQVNELVKQLLLNKLEKLLLIFAIMDRVR